MVKTFLGYYLVFFNKLLIFLRFYGIIITPPTILWKLLGGDQRAQLEVRSKKLCLLIAGVEGKVAMPYAF